MLDTSNTSNVIVPAASFSGNNHSDYSLSGVESSNATPLLSSSLIYADQGSVQHQKQVIFIDSKVDDYNVLAENAIAGMTVVLLDSTRDGITQITETLAEFEDVSGVHIISHGGPGHLQLGNSIVDIHTLRQNKTALQTWAEALTPAADILVFGCHVASGESGSAFVRALSQLTDADVAASTDLTGDANQGGNWNLELATGPVEFSLPFQPTFLNSYQGLLATFNFTDFSDTSGLRLNGSAARAGTNLALTPAATSRAGTAFFATPIAIDANTSFQTAFQFQLTGSTTGADGFVFMLQNSPAGAGALGASGGSLGYGGTTGVRVTRSLAVEFDTFRNGWDPNANHIAILRDGVMRTALATTSTGIPDLNSGALINAWVNYSGLTNQLDVFLSTSATRPATAALSHTIDLATVLGSQAFVGFGAGTGSLVNAHTLTNWQFTSDSAPPAPTPGVTLTQSGDSTSVTEGGATDSYTLVLNAAPTADVAIALTNVGGQTTTSSSSVTFTPANWNVPQTVIVTAVNDTAVEGPHSSTITHTVTSADARYSGLTIPAVSVAITDNDSPTPPPAGTGTGLLGEYFNNIDFTAPVLTRTDATVNFDWGSGSPAPSIEADTFSVRWTGQIEPRFSETYTFFTTSDDGVRLFINNQLVIDSFVDQPATERSGTITLVAGQRYDIRMEYYERGGQAVAQLAWASASQPRQIIPASQLFSPSIVALGNSETIFVNEAAGVATVTVVRTGNTQERVTLEYTTNEIGGTDAATAGVDYTLPTLGARANTGQIVFEVGDTEETFTIPIINDTLQESNETFAIGLQNPSSGILGFPRTLLITIVDNDVPSSISLGSANLSVSEGTPTATLTVQRSGSTDGTSTVRFATSNGTAIAGSDYTASTGTITFAPGQTSQSIAIPILNDTTVEGTETFSVTLSAPTGAALGSRTSATVSILDNDSALSGLVRRTAVTGLNQPTKIDWTPDGRFMLIAQKNGIVRVFDNAPPSGGPALRSTPLIDLSSEVNDTRDRGLLGMAIHPNFPTTPYVYLLHTYDPPETAGRTGLAGPDGNGNRPSRLVRMTVNPTTMVADRSTLVVLAGTNSTWANTNRPDGNSTGDLSIPPSGIFTGTPSATTPPLDVGTQDNDPNRAGIQNQNIRDYLATDSESHTIGAVHFGPDGLLYLSNGDGTSYNFMDPRTVRVQDIQNLSGKVLRIDPITGDGVSTNPFFDGNPDSNRSKVFYYGLRNPFRFAFDPVTNLPVIGDVGWTRWEEINTGEPGSNFGWPYLEGPGRTGGYSRLSQAIAFYNNGNRNAPTDAPAVFPILSRSHGAPDGANAIMVGDFFDANTLIFGDVVDNVLYVATLDSSRRITSVQILDESATTVVDAEMGPDGRLYAVSFFTGSIWRWDPPA